MMDKAFGWDLPPGVTQKMIDDYFGGKPICVPCENSDHSECEQQGCECDPCREAEMEDYYESLAEERMMERRHA